MKLSLLSSLYTEGVVSAARGNIINTTNQLASQASQVIKQIIDGLRPSLGNTKISEPDVKFSSTESVPASVNVTVGTKSPQFITTTVYGDGGGEIELAIGDRLSKVLTFPPITDVSSVDELGKKIGELLNKLVMHVNGNRSQT